MKLWKKISITIVIILALIFSALYLFLVFRGRALIIKGLENLTHKKVTIGYIGLTPPLHLEIKDLNIEDSVKVESVYISPSIIGFFTGNVAFNNIKLIRPYFIYTRGPKDVGNSSVMPAKELPLPAATEEKNKKRMRFIAKRIKISEGRIDFIDLTAGTGGIRIALKDINFNLRNLFAFPSSVITSFNLNAKIPWEKGRDEGVIEAEGWLNFAKKDMQATLNIKDIDGIYLYPYYSDWVDLEKARIQSAKLNFTSDIHGLSNNVTALCHLELTDIVRKPLEEGQSEEKASKVTAAVLDIFRTLNQGKVVLDFTIRTKMDRPEFSFTNIKMALEDKLHQGGTADTFEPQDVLLLPSKFWEEVVKYATKFSKVVIDSSFMVGNEIKKSVEDIFKKEPEKKTE